MKQLVFILCVGLLLACNDKKDDPKIECPECTGDILCTEEFRTLTFTVTYSSGAPVTLDDFEVTIVETGEVLDHGDWLGLLAPGAYIIAQDSDFEKVDCEGTEFRFEGFLNESKVVDEIFVIGRDCCHILLVDGPDNIQIP